MILEEACHPDHRPSQRRQRLPLQQPRKHRFKARNHEDHQRHHDAHRHHGDHGRIQRRRLDTPLQLLRLFMQRRQPVQTLVQPTRDLTRPDHAHIPLIKYARLLAERR